MTREETSKPKKRGGPKSAVGKSRSRLNAVKHGVFSKLDVLPWESPKVYRRFVKKRIDHFAPQSPYERELVEDLARIEWKMRRLEVFENASIVKKAVKEVIEPELLAHPLPPMVQHDPEALSDQLKRLTPTGKALYTEVIAWAKLRC